MHTIEDDLLDGLAKAGAFPEDMKDNMGKVRSLIIGDLMTTSYDVYDIQYTQWGRDFISSLVWSNRAKYSMSHRSHTGLL